MASVLRGKFRFVTMPCTSYVAWACHFLVPLSSLSPLIMLLLLLEIPHNKHTNLRAFALAVHSTWNALP